MAESSYKNRFSNYELLRIVAMILIILGHTHLRMDTTQITGAIVDNPLTCYWKNVLNCIVTIGVGIFIAISGWFGIKFKIEGLAKYIFLVFFTLWVVYGIAIASHIADFNISGIIISLSFFEGYWFVMGYLGLYLISPILNTFVEHAPKKSLQLVLISYFLFQSYFSWLSGWYNYYDGYSIILFSGIYLTAAYLRKYPVRMVEKYAPQLWVATILLMAVIATLAMYKLGNAGRMIRDDNPLAILASVLLLLSFKKLKFQSKIINWLAASCFAVYLIHYSPFVYPYFKQLICNIYIQYDGLIYGLILLCIILCVYCACALIDQIRIFSWNIFSSLLKKRL
jgi:surface polysaccharide O-acyltransferase-like enzyme